MDTIDGLTQTARMDLISKLRYPQVLDNRLKILLDKSVLIASYLKYFTVGPLGELLTEDHFDVIFKKALQDDNIKHLSESHEMDPSFSILYNFLENLQQTTASFNTRWRDLPDWYLKDFIGIKSRSTRGDKVWVSFKNSGEDSFVIPQKTGFKVDYDHNATKYYELTEDVEVHSSAIQKVYLLKLKKERSNGKSPYPIKTVTLHELPIQDRQAVHPGKDIGIQIGARIISPALVLREGNRTILLNCYPVNPEWSGDSDYNSLNSIFKIGISVENGWLPIEEYTVNKEKEKLVIQFVLPDHFPSTAACTIEKHQYTSEYPVVNLALNLESSDYQESKIENFQISRVKVIVSAKSITNIKVYNELGKIDNSKPFVPFGINSEKGAWFTIGNYEMNIKNTKGVHVNLYWEKLPEHPLGLAYHYMEYEKGIGNESFEVSVRYLSDFQWKRVSGKNEFPLFNTEKGANSLSNLTSIGPIDVEKMPLIKEEEEEYDYSLNTRNGFLNFQLINPEIGFGEQVYRKIFTEQMMRNARKKQKYPTIQPPIQPVLKRITIDYEAEDIIDHRRHPDSSGGRIESIMPLEEFVTDRPVANDFIWFVPQMEDRNLIIVLDNVKENATLNIFFDMHPTESNDIHEESVRERRHLLRDIRIYIGNPACWKRMPLAFIIKDETMAFLISGYVKFQFPDALPPELYDDNGMLWIRIGFENVEGIGFPEIKNAFVNAALLKMRMPEDEEESFLLNPADGEIAEEALIPGLGQIIRISDFYGGMLKESKDQMFLRMAEYVSHKGRAVTTRDYERLVLQAFPDIAKAKCIFSKSKKTQKNTVYLVVLPKQQNGADLKKPLTAPHLLYFIEKYLRGLASAYVQHVNVINPVYEQVIIRCRLDHKSFFSLRRKKLLAYKINQFIAPWQSDGTLPVIGHVVDLKKMHNELIDEFGGEIVFSDFSAICIERKSKDFYIKEFFYKKDGSLCSDYLITPLEFHSILIPADEHIILDQADCLEHFGINEMTIGNSFIIPKK